MNVHSHDSFCLKCIFQSSIVEERASQSPQTYKTHLDLIRTSRFAKSGGADPEFPAIRAQLVFGRPGDGCSTPSRCVVCSRAAPRRWPSFAMAFLQCFIWEVLPQSPRHHRNLICSVSSGNIEIWTAQWESEEAPHYAITAITIRTSTYHMNESK